MNLYNTFRDQIHYIKRYGRTYLWGIDDQCFLMAFTGIVFGVIGYHAEEGGVTSKKMAVYLNIIVFIISGIFL